MFYHIPLLGLSFLNFSRQAIAGTAPFKAKFLAAMHEVLQDVLAAGNTKRWDEVPTIIGMKCRISQTT